MKSRLKVFSVSFSLLLLSSCASVQSRTDAGAPIEVLGGHEFNGYATRYTQKGKPLDSRELMKAISESQTVSVAVKESVGVAKTYDTVRKLVVIPAAFLVGYGVGTMFNGSENWAVLGSGFGLFGVSFLFRILHENRLDDAVREYNQSLASPAKLSLQFQPRFMLSSDSASVGFQLIF